VPCQNEPALTIGTAIAPELAPPTRQFASGMRDFPPFPFLFPSPFPPPLPGDFLIYVYPARSVRFLASLSSTAFFYRPNTLLVCQPAFCIFIGSAVRGLSRPHFPSASARVVTSFLRVPHSFGLFIADPVVSLMNNAIPRQQGNYALPAGR